MGSPATLSPTHYVSSTAGHRTHVFPGEVRSQKRLPQASKEQPRHRESPDPSPLARFRPASPQWEWPPGAGTTSLVHHEVPGAELVVVQVVHREEVVGADVALDGAVLPHHVC